MCIICKGRDLDGLKKLNCSNCSQLREIPNIKGLEVLDCNDCPLIREIPNISGLKYLYCYNCPLLTSISKMDELKELWCYNCPQLISIPNNKYSYLNPRNCPFLNHPFNGNYSSNLNKLITLQKYIKRKLKK